MLHKYPMYQIKQKRCNSNRKCSLRDSKYLWLHLIRGFIELTYRFRHFTPTIRPKSSGVPPISVMTSSKILLLRHMNDTYLNQLYSNCVLYTAEYVVKLRRILVPGNIYKVRNRTNDTSDINIGRISENISYTVTLGRSHYR